MTGNHSQDTTRDLAVTALMAALVFTGTYFFKIPVVFGYGHLGDGMILLTVFLLGSRRGAIAGAIGAGFADLLGGYAIWVLPTMILKSLWALTAGFVSDRLFPGHKYSRLLGAVIGGVLHILGYTLVNGLFYGQAAAMAELVTTASQTAAGIVVGMVAYRAVVGTVLKSSPTHHQ